jgi:hypothetical protein
MPQTGKNEIAKKNVSALQTILTKLTKSQLFHRKEKLLLFSDENFAKSYEKLAS